MSEDERSAERERDAIAAHFDVAMAKLERAVEVCRRWEFNVEAVQRFNISRRELLAQCARELREALAEPGEGE